MVYILRSDGTYCQFDGMTQDQITAMLSEQGLSCTFVDQTTYQASLPKVS